MTECCFIDVSHEIEDGMISYPGLPAPKIRDHLDRETACRQYGEGCHFHIGAIEMVANTGTYIDAPFHRYAEGHDLAGFDLTSIANLEGCVIRVDITENRALGPRFFQGRDVAGKAVLVHTGWDRHWRTEAYAVNYPFLTEEAGLYLRDAGAALVGIDSLNIDDKTDGRRPVHTHLLAADIPIVEHLCNLVSLPQRGFRFFAVPAPIKGLGSFPVRAFAIVDKPAA